MISLIALSIFLFLVGSLVSSRRRERLGIISATAICIFTSAGIYLICHWLSIQVASEYALASIFLWLGIRSDGSIYRRQIQKPSISLSIDNANQSKPLSPDREFGFHVADVKEYPQPSQILTQASSSSIQTKRIESKTVSATVNNTPLPIQQRRSELSLTNEINQVYQHLEDLPQCLLITGGAGTGKSTLLKSIVNNTDKKVAVVAPTGIAAINVEGQTIHSFFSLPPRTVTPSDIKVTTRGQVCKVLDCLIIDEISMVRSDIMEGIDLFLRKNGRNSGKPFGGIPILLFGDLFQLPPVVSKGQETEYLTRRFSSEFFFDVPVFQETGLRTVELTKVYRQSDPEFISLLHRLRLNQMRTIDIEFFNQRFDPTFEPQDNDGYITLTPTNNRVAEINDAQLEKLRSPDITYTATVEGDFDSKAYPTDRYLKLKIGAQVIFVKNDPEKRWVNGTIGFITELFPDQILVSVLSDMTDKEIIYEVPLESWENFEYELDPVTDDIYHKVTGTFIQFPLKLAWAMTIHKSQGKTFDRVIVDFGSGAFAHGQAYVALSRCRTLQGTVLKTRLRRNDIKVDERVARFMKNALRTDG